MFLISLFVDVSMGAAACGPLPAGTGDMPKLAEGYSVHHYFTDSSLDRRWAVVIDCQHPERPASLVMAPAKEYGRVDRASRSETSGAPPLVTAGAHVRLWSARNGAEIQLEGIALGSASVGEMLRVRAGLKGTVLDGVVRGPGSVELAVRGQGDWGKP
jgi:hypothetical protein